METQLEGWSEFNVAVAGAGAALAGLIIVAMSVNIAEILKAETLPARAGASIGALLLGVAVSCLALIPGHAVWLIGVEVLVGALLVWKLQWTAVRAIAHEQRQQVTGRALKILISVIPILLFSVGGVVLTIGAPEGYVWIAAGIVMAIVGAVLFSWVALVEILR